MKKWGFVWIGGGMGYVEAASKEEALQKANKQARKKNRSLLESSIHILFCLEMENFPPGFAAHRKTSP